MATSKAQEQAEGAGHAAAADHHFLLVEPDPATAPKKLAEVSARLCRLLRDEVVEQMALGSEG